MAKRIKKKKSKLRYPKEKRLCNPARNTLIPDSVMQSMSHFGLAYMLGSAILKLVGIDEKAMPIEGLVIEKIEGEDDAEAK